MVVAWSNPVAVIVNFTQILINIVEFVNHHAMCNSLLAVVDVHKKACNGKNCMRVDLVGKHQSKAKQKHKSFCDFVEKFLQVEIN